MAKIVLGVTSILYAVAILSITIASSPGPTQADWPSTIMKALDQRDSLLDSVRKINKEHTIKNIKESLPILQELPSKFKNFHKTDFTTVKKHNDPTAHKFFRMIDQKYIKLEVRDLFRPPALEVEYRRKGVGFMLAKFKSSYDMKCIYQLISPPTKPRDIQIPLKQMCAGLKTPNSDYAPITKICLDFNTCVASKKNGIVVPDACTSYKKCDVVKAVPKCGALLWYKISNYLAQIMCGTTLLRRVI